MKELMPTFPVNNTEKVKKKTFEEQFSNKLEIDGVDAVKIEKNEDNDKLPILFAPGWSRTQETFKDSLKVLHNCDRDVISLDHSRKGGAIEDNEETNNFPKEVQRRATALHKIIKNEMKSGEEGINIAAQSMGGMDAIVATLMAEAENPGSVKNLVLVNPAGMIGKDSVLELGVRFAGQMKQNTEIKEDESRPNSAKENVNIAGKEFFKYVKENPLRAIKEISAMTSMEITELLVELKNRGIGISIIHGVDDLTFQMDRVQKNAKSEQLDGFYSVKGGHNELYLNPEKYMALVEQAFSALENKAKQNDTKQQI